MTPKTGTAMWEKHPHLFQATYDVICISCRSCVFVEGAGESMGTGSIFFGHGGSKLGRSGDGKH